MGHSLATIGSGMKGQKRGKPNINGIIRKIRLLVFDFDGVFTDNMVYTFEDGKEAICCSRSDGLGLQKLKAHNIDMLVLSTEENPVVSMRCKKIGLPYIQGSKEKLTSLKEIIITKGISLDEVAYVGNDINDISCLMYVGFPIIVQDAHPDVVSYGLYRTERPGGKGAVREVCDLFDTAIKSS